MGTVFISYRRDDTAGYAGRLEEALERRLGRGSVFRDVQDISPGEDFVAAIRRRLGDASAVLVLIGARWLGDAAAGARRIDDEKDFVRLEVQVALESGVRVLPVLMPGVAMPAESQLPEPLRALARRQALQLSDTHWQADIDRLVAACGISPRRAVWPWAAGGAVVAAAAVAALCAWQRTPADLTPRLVGRWQAEVRYDWGARYTETFEFKRHAGALTGTATFLDYPRPIEKMQVEGANLRFETHSEETMGSESRIKTHSYAAELRGQPPDEVLAFRMQTSGGFGSPRPLEFEARRSAAPPAAAASKPAR